MFVVCDQKENWCDTFQTAQGHALNFHKIQSQLLEMYSWLGNYIEWTFNTTVSPGH